MYASVKHGKTPDKRASTGSSKRVRSTKHVRWKLHKAIMAKKLIVGLLMGILANATLKSDHSLFHLKKEKQEKWARVKQIGPRKFKKGKQR